MPMSQADFDRFMAPEVHNQALRRSIACATFAGNPTGTLVPEALHQFCFDTTNADLYWASTTAAAGWKKLNN